MKRTIWFAAAVIAIAALLVPLLSGLVRDVLLVELLRFAWWVDLLIGSLPQEPFWIAFLFVALLVAAVTILPRPRQPDEPHEPERRATRRVADLALLIQRARRRPYFRRRLVQRLSHLGREAFGDTQPSDPSFEQALAHLRAEPTTDAAVEFFVQFLQDRLEVDHAPVHRTRR